MCVVHIHEREGKDDNESTIKQLFEIFSKNISSSMCVEEFSQEAKKFSCI